MKKLIISLFIMALGISLSGAAYGGTETGTLNVSANSVAACTVTVIPIDFGDYVGTVDKYANGDVIVNCNDGVGYSISLDAGSNYESSFATYRHVCGASAPSDCSPYLLYQDVGLTTEWGDGSSTHPAAILSDLSTIADGTDQSHPVYGWLLNRSPAPPVGLLSDVVNVSVNY
jgi:spore coat protein U-like protein